MKKLYLIISIIIYGLFVFLFLRNVFQDFDLFYVMWGAITFPVPVAFLYIYRGHSSFVNKILYVAIVTLLLLLLLVQLIPTGNDPSTLNPIHIYLTMFLGFVFFIVLLTSYTLTFVHYKTFDKEQIILFVLIFIGFILCRLSFSRDLLLEYISGVLLFGIITYAYFRMVQKLVIYNIKEDTK